MKTHIFYHSADLDGHCSGAIARQAHPGAELHGIDYGDGFPFDQIHFAYPVRVIMVDFSLQPWSDMQRLAAEAGELIWIDHHRTAIDELEKNGWVEELHPQQDPPHVTTVLNDKKAACELAWKHFFPDTPTPRAVYLLGRYDVWDLDADPDILAFQFGMRLEDTDPKGDFNWEEFLATDQDNFPVADIEVELSKGYTVLAYQRQQNQRLMHSSFVHTFRGLRFLCVNAGGINSQAFESAYDPKEHDAVMSFYYAGDKQCWTFSLYSPDQRFKEDSTLSDIAKDLGGGGHNCACGFQTTLLRDVFNKAGAPS